MRNGADFQNDMRFARFLKFWRQVRKLSQEELAHRIDSSPRHISRLENGSSRPSEPMVEDIAAAFELTDRDRNHLRLAAGFNPRNRKLNFRDTQLHWLRNAMRMTLRALDPYPTVLSDSSSTILMVNRSWVGLYQKVLTPEQLNVVTNHFEFLFSNPGGGTVMSAWEDSLSLILMSLEQAAMLNDNPEEMAMLEKFRQSPNLPTDWRERGSRLEPMASYRINVEYDGAMRCFYNVNQMVSAAGPAAYVDEPKLYLNTLYPEDEGLDLSSLVEEGLRHPLLCY